MNKTLNEEKGKEIMVKDLVCKMEKPKNQMSTSTVYKGKTYYFCWEGDKQIFLRSPKHWISKD